MSPGVRLGHEREAALVLDRQVLDAVLAVAAAVELELGLEVEPGERLGPHASGRACRARGRRAARAS